MFWGKFFYHNIDPQVRDPESFRPLSVPQIEIPFRDMASFVAEADASISERFDVLEPKIYNSDARCPIGEPKSLVVKRHLKRTQFRVATCCANKV
jgi:hypothetical protein